MKIGLLVRFFLVSAALTVIVASAKIAVRTPLMLREGQRLQAEKQYARALQVYLSLAELRPTLAAPHTHLGEIYAAQSRWDEARSEFALARHLDPTSAEPLCGLAQVAYSRREPATAVKLWSQALALEPCSMQARCGLGRAYIAWSRFDLAEQHLRRGLLCDPRHQEAQYLLGVIAANNGDPLAIDHLSAATQGDDQRLSRKAAEMVRLLTRLPGGQDETYAAGCLARAFLSYDLPSLAIEQLKRVLDEDPENGTANAYLGYALLALGEPNQALRVLREATRREPKNPLGHYFLGRVHRSEGYLNTALWNFKRSLALDPSNAAAYAETAGTYEQMSQFSAAEEWYQAAVALAPEEAGFQLLLAEFYVDVVPNQTAGLAAAEKAAFLAPDDPVAQDLLGWAHYLAGDLDKAREALERAISLDPGFARAYYRLGLVCSQLGDRDTALWGYQRAVDLDTEGLYRTKAIRELSAAGWAEGPAG